MRVVTMEEDGRITAGARVDEYVTRRREVIPVISVGEDVEGGWLAFVGLKLTQETDALWNHKEENVTVQEVRKDAYFPGMSRHNGRRRDWETKLVEAGNWPTASKQAVVVIRRHLDLNPDLSRFPRDCMARGYTAANATSGGGQQVIVIVQENEVIRLALQAGGHEEYILLANGVLQRQN